MPFSEHIWHKMLCYFPATIKIYFRFVWLFFYLVINKNIFFKWAQKASVFGIKKEIFSLGSKTPFGWWYVCGIRLLGCLKWSTQTRWCKKMDRHNIFLLQLIFSLFALHHINMVWLLFFLIRACRSISRKV